MNNNEQSPLKRVLCIAILAFLIGILYSYYKSSTTLRSKDLDLNKSFTLKIKASEGGEVFGGGKYKAGSLVSILAEPKDGFTFQGWVGSYQLENSDRNTSFQISDDMKITARFSEIKNELTLSGDKPMTIRDFEGFETSQYFEESGKKMITLKFASADVERPKVGFLRMGLAFLMVRNLEIFINTDGLSAEFIHSKIKELKKHKGVSYAVSEPVTFWFTGNLETLKVNANKGKFTSAGAFRLWGGVRIDKNEKIIHAEKLEIKISSDRQNIHFIDAQTGKILDQLHLD